MSVHIFHHRCDKCGTCSPEYDAFPHCRECLDDLCYACAFDHDAESGTAICAACKAELAAFAGTDSGERSDR